MLCGKVIGLFIAYKQGCEQLLPILSNTSLCSFGVIAYICITNMILIFVLVRYIQKLLFIFGVYKV